MMDKEKDIIEQFMEIDENEFLRAELLMSYREEKGIKPVLVRAAEIPPTRQLHFPTSPDLQEAM